MPGLFSGTVTREPRPIIPQPSSSQSVSSARQLPCFTPSTESHVAPQVCAVSYVLDGQLTKYQRSSDGRKVLSPFGTTLRPPKA